jgi:hypothetical protein
VVIDDEQAKKAYEALHCKADELPETLNTHRYLDGLDGEQKDFHMRQQFRVDHLWHNQGHQIQFTLKEPTLVRIVAPVHNNLPFELVLNEDKGTYDHKTVMRAKREDYHSTIFAQLEAGRYHIKVTFVTDAAVLQMPCQTVQLEMAFMTIERAKLRASTLRENAQKDSTEKLSMKKLLTGTSDYPVNFF